LKNTAVNQAALLLALKLILAPLAVLLASIASKRYGHIIGGILSGFPMIAAPVTAALLIDHPAEHVTAIAFATVSGLIATFGFIVAFAWVAKTNKPWWFCLACATTAFVLVALLLKTLELATPLSVVLGVAAPWFARFALPKIALPEHPPVIPSTELALRVLGAFFLAAALLFSAGRTAPWLSGLLIAWPITGSILPCFTQKIAGAKATIAFFSGFSRGLVGLATFFCVLGLLLPVTEKPIAYALALLGAATIAITLAKRSKQIS
jgi:hypothetical protein